jgi:protein-S-isoprenylcysteine O-methyltransferase Ste14
MTAMSVDSWRALPYILVPVVAGASGIFLGAIDPFRLSGGFLQALGMLPLFGGLAIVYWTVQTMSRTGQSLSPVADPDELVTTGAFAHTRNPMYLGVVLAVFGIAVLAGSPLVATYGVLLGLTYHCIVVRLEESKLQNAFGSQYESYREEVPRWLPRLRR